jgi:CheY-like chemotaxis protein
MEESGWRKKTVCIVDDDENVRDIYRAKFQKEGFVVILAQDGEAGVALIRAQQPDIILLDLQMPILDGFEVLRILKSDEHLTRIPVVIFSNVEDEAVFQKVEALGSAQYYLIKSLTDSQKVVDIVLKVLAEQTTGK